MYERALRGELVDTETRKKFGIDGMSAHAHHMLLCLLSIARAGGLIHLKRGQCTLQELTGRGEHATSEALRELLGEGGSNPLLHKVDGPRSGEFMLQIIEPVLVAEPQLPRHRSLAQMEARRRAYQPSAAERRDPRG